jgi:ribonuclease VapC
MQTVKPIYVLDACALLRLAQDEPGADQVEEILRTAQADECRVLLHQINLGKVVYRIGRALAGRLPSINRLKSVCCR